MNKSGMVTNLIKIATEVATYNQNRYLGPEHLLYALVAEVEPFADALENFGVDIAQLNAYLENEVFARSEKLKMGSSNPTPTYDYKQVIDRATEMAQFNGGSTIITSQIVLALLEQTDTTVSCYLESVLQDIDAFRTAIAHLPMGDESSFNKTQNSNSGAGTNPQMDPFGNFLGMVLGLPFGSVVSTNPFGQTQQQQQQKPTLKYLSKYGTLLNEQEFKPVIGRANEIAMTCRTLARKDKCNPIHVGEPGVGKTAIVHGLVQAIKDGNVPTQLKDAIIYEVSMGTLVAGTKYRGEFEERLKGIINDAMSDKNIILYIDEIHQLIGSGAAGNGSMDGAQILKPYLQDGTIRCIGATTYAEYKKYIESDAALMRRFKKIDVPEPSVDEAIQIMTGLKGTYEKHHNVTYTPEALSSAVNLSKKYIADRYLPDKAIDLIDEAGAYVNQKNLSTRVVTDELIQEILAETCNIPKATIGSDEKTKLQNLAKEMKKVVFGQDTAIDALVKAIIKSRAGLSNENKPMGSYLFVGPTGTGKTEVSKQLAKQLGIDFIKYDMSEYMDEHTSAKLIGTPPGYVGYEEGGLLVEDIRKHPYCVLLLDEIEKAHQKIFDVFLQVMDDATLTDNKGRKADFRNVIIIMTSNAGASSMGQRGIGFNAKSKDASVMTASVESTFKPEFRNRLSGTIVFNSMSPEMAKLIANRQLDILKDLLANKGITLKTSKKIVEVIADKVQKPEFGGREIIRIIEDEIKPLFSEPLVFGTLKAGDTCTLTYKNDKFGIRYNKQP